MQDSFSRKPKGLLCRYIFRNDCRQNRGYDRLHIIIVIIGLLILSCPLLLSGCAHHGQEESLNEFVAPSADRVWVPPVDQKPQIQPGQKPIDIPEDLLQPGKQWRLMDIIEIALRNNPQTRAAWYSARAAAADMLSQKGSYYPQVGIAAEAGQTNIIAPEDVDERSIRNFNPALELSWLIFDFGGRDASVEEKRQALIAADFTHNATIQDVVLLVLQAYFRYAKAKALVKTSETSLNEAAQNLEAAQTRHREGFATIADVLQAQTAVSQAKLNLEEAQGQVQIIRGALATAMGVPANTPYDIENLTWEPPVDRLMDQVEVYIQQAQAKRPDLAAQKSLVEQAVANIRVSRSALYPNVTLNNEFTGWIGSDKSQWANQNTASLTVNIPLFYGYSNLYNLRVAEQNAKAQQEQFNILGQQIIFQVWSSYFNLKTAGQRVHTSDDLIKSATQSYDVAYGRYKEGVGGFLDLLAAQTTLENARSQRVDALADWYISLANLSRDTGELWSQDPDEKGIFEILPSTKMKENKP
jgi:TolC family type I secretion outer membrane protein